MEKTRYGDFVLPLKEMALRRATFYLCIETILEDIEQIDLHYQSFIEVLRIKLPKLVLPENLKKRIGFLIEPIACDIFIWARHIGTKCPDRHYVLDPLAMRQIRFTWCCAIDYQKTARGLAQCEVLDVWSRFEIACWYCLEDEIRLLWEELPAKKNTWCTDEVCTLRDVRMSHYWCYVLREEGTNLEQLLEKKSMNPLDFHRHAFKTSAVDGNKAAAQFFLQKLPNGETDTLFTTFDSVLGEQRRKVFFSDQEVLPDAEASYADVIVYLLSIMSPEQQMQVFSEHPIHVLTTFLNWRCHHLLSYVAGLCWSFFPESKYYQLLCSMNRTIRKLEYYVPNVFQEFFIRSPVGLRKAFVRVSDFLSQVFISQDAETIRVIFRNLEASDRMRLVFSDYFFQLLNSSLSSGRRNMVEVCIREATLSKEDRQRLKASFMERVTRTDARARGKWRRLVEFLDGMDAEQSVAQEETLPRAKKLCT